MADEGLIDGKRTAFHRMGGVPKVTVLRVIEIEDGEAIAIPDSWQPDDAIPPPRLRLREKGRPQALRSGRPGAWPAPRKPASAGSPIR
jgi:ribonuclease R